MQEQAPAISDPLRTTSEQAAPGSAAAAAAQRRKAMRIAAAFLVAAVGLTCAADAFGPVVDAIGGMLAAFAIATAVHVLQPRPMLRFLLVVVALACLSVTFATVLHIHLHGAS
jgi:hypothetical protein